MQRAAARGVRRPPTSRERPQSVPRQARRRRHPKRRAKRAGNRPGPGPATASGPPAAKLADRRGGRAGPREQLAALLPVLLWHGAGQRTILHPVLPLLDLEPGRPGGPEACGHLGAGHVPGPVHQGHHPLAAALLAARGQTGGLLQLGVQHALYPRHGRHRHPHFHDPPHLRPLAVSSYIWTDSYSLLVFPSLPK